MQYLKRNTKYSILAFLILLLSMTISISTLAKTEVYFSLSDNPQKVIIKNINQAQASINIAMYIFTDREIALPLVKAHERGVKVRLYLDQDQVDYQYSQSRFLVQRGIKTRISYNNYIMHNKFAVIDNRILLSGSYNWTFSANNRNDENLMVIDDPEIIEIFQNKIININSVSLEELTGILQISQPLAQKIITLRDSLSGGFKDPQDLFQLSELNNLDLLEWREEGIIITID